MTEELFCFEEMIHLTTMKKIKKESLQDLYWLNNNSNLQKLCKCGVTKKISSLMESKFKLEKIKVEDMNLIAFKNNILKDFSNCIENSRKYLQSIEKNCHHTVNELSNDIENVIKNNEKIPIKF